MSHDNSAFDNNREKIRTFLENDALYIALLSLNIRPDRLLEVIIHLGLFCLFFLFCQRMKDSHSHSFFLTSLFVEFKREYKS